MLEHARPFVLLAAWIALGVSIGFVSAHTVFGVVRGVRTVWPMAFLFTITGWMASGMSGMVLGLMAAAMVGFFVGRA